MLVLRKLLKLPGPVELGRSKYSALPSREFTPDVEGYCWEDWEDEVKKLHPIKYWIAETAADFLRYNIWLPVLRPIRTLIYWLKSHTYKRYHMLDLRQPCGKEELSNIDCYRYGWCDVQDKMLYAMFNLLGEFLNKESPNDLTEWHTKEEIDADEGMKQQQDDLDEAKTIYQWWIVGRKISFKEQNDMQTLWWEAKKNKQSNSEEYWERMNKLTEEFDAKTEEMVMRLMKIRRTLWS